MSYTIERYKRVLELKTEDKRFAPYLGNTILFLSQSSCNNVSPRHYDWSVLALDHCRDWNGQIMLPELIWKCGAYADGGGIKPWNKEVSGLAYVKSWKQAVKNRTPIDGWEPELSVWIGGYEDGRAAAEKLNQAGAEGFGKYKHNQESLWEAFKRIFPNPLTGGHQTRYLTSREQLLDALWLFQNREGLPVSIYISDRERSSFFKTEENYEAQGGAA